MKFDELLAKILVLVGIALTFIFLKETLKSFGLVLLIIKFKEC
ncbi:hypothetical protein HPCPY1124_0206 [Helicobacter pylori CPY1124]|nr:hypothetical protein HPCPY1124_0206 [Helicobacter pylori CPY1124]